MCDALHDLHLTDIDVGAPVEPDLNRTETLLTERFDMLNIGGGTDGFLDRIQDTLLNIERRGSLVENTDERDGDLDVGEEVDWQSIEGGCAQDHQG